MMPHKSSLSCPRVVGALFSDVSSGANGIRRRFARRNLRRVVVTLSVLNAFSLLTVSGLAAAADGASDQSVVGRCRAADAEFDYEQAVQECAIAASDTSLSKAERLEVYRTLGVAHTAMKQEERAATWFTRLLVIDPTHELPSTVSPVYRDAFAKAKARFADQGKVSVTALPALPGDAPGTMKIGYDVKDALGRVTEGRVLIVSVHASATGRPIDVPLARAPASEPGTWKLEGIVNDPGPPDGIPGSYIVEYRLVLKNSVGDDVATEPPVPPSSFPGTKMVTEEEINVPLVVGGVAGALAVGVAVVGVSSIAAVCLLTPTCQVGGDTTAKVAVSPAE